MIRLSLQPSMVFQRQMGEVSGDFKNFKEKARIFRSFVTSETLFDDYVEYHRLLNAFEEAIITASETSKKLIERQTMPEGVQPPPAAPPEQPQPLKEPGKPSTAHVVLAGLTFASVFMAVKEGFITGDILIYLAFATVALAFLPFLGSLKSLFQREKEEEQYLSSKQQWLASKLSFLRDRYNALYLDLKFKEAGPGEIAEFADYSDTVKDPKETALREAKCTLLPVTTEIINFVNEAVEDKRNTLNSCIVQVEAGGKGGVPA